MHGYTTGERPEVGTAFQTGNDSALGMLGGDVLDLARNPDVIVLDQCERCHIVVPMRVEAGGDEDRLWTEYLQSRQPLALHYFAECAPAGVGGKRNVDHTLRATRDTAVRVKRMLERRYHHHARIVAKDVFGAIAMMHIEIYDRDPLQTVRFERV